MGHGNEVSNIHWHSLTIEVGCGWEGDRCRVLVPLYQIPFICLLDLITDSAWTVMLSQFESFMKHSQGFCRTTSAVHTRRCVWKVCGCLSLVGYFCSTSQLGLVVFGTLMKGDGGQNVAFPMWRHCLSLGFQKCFISKAQNGCVKFAVQALLNWQWKRSILLKMSGSGGWNNHNSYFACYVFLI